MGTVWRAEDALLGRPVAVKEVELPSGAGAGPGALRERALREARAARLNHPGVVTLHDVVEADGRLFLVMELVLAPTLGELVDRSGPLTPAAAGPGRAAAGRRAGGGPRGRDRPPRRQAGQRDGRRGRPGQAGRLRHRLPPGGHPADADRGRRGRNRDGGDRDRWHGLRRDRDREWSCRAGGDGGVRVAAVRGPRAGRRAAGRAGGRPVGAGGDPVVRGRGRGPVRARPPGGHPRRHPVRSTRPPGPGRPARARPARPAGQGPVPPPAGPGRPPDAGPGGRRARASDRPGGWPRLDRAPGRRSGHAGARTLARPARRGRVRLEGWTAPPRRRRRGRWLLAAAVVLLLLAVASNLGDRSSGDPGPAGLGDPVRDGQFEFVVRTVDCGGRSVGEGFGHRTALGQFCLVRFRVENAGTEGRTFGGGQQYLFDRDGNRHDPDPAATLGNGGEWSAHLNPGQRLAGTLVYDIPEAAVPARVELHDAAFSGGASVALD